MMPGLSVPNYATGYARCEAESAAPEMWQGLRGCWAPYLGATGRTLHTMIPPAIDLWGAPYPPGAWKVDTVGAYTYWNGNARYFWGQPEASLRTDYLTLAVLLRIDTTDNMAAYYHYNRFGYAVILRHWFGNVQLILEDAVTSNAIDMSQSTWFPLGQWRLFVGTYDGTTQRGYVNGVEAATPETVLSGPINHYPDKTIDVGRGPGAANYWYGGIAGIYVWDHALNPTQIARLAADPYLVLRRRRRIVARVAAGPGITVPRMMHQYRMRRAG